MGTSYSARGQSATGARPQVVRHGTGDYTVSFRGTRSGGGTVMVTAEDLSLSRQCSVAGWSPTEVGLEARVLCSDLAGQPADSRFYAAFVAKTGTERGAYAYLWAERPSSTARYATSPAYRYNSSGGTNTVARVSLGRYRVHLPGLAVDGGTFKVTAYGDRSACTVAHSAPHRTRTRQELDVRCFGPSGQPADARFALVFADRRSLLGTGGPAGHGFAAWPDDTSPYDVDPRYGDNSTGGAVRVLPGELDDTFHLGGLTHQPGAVMVTAFSEVLVVCGVTFQRTAPSPHKRYGVFCVDRERRPVAVPYATQFFRQG